MLTILAVLVLAGCEAGPSGPTPAISPGTDASPREVNIIAKDWIFLPDKVEVVPGETVILHVVNGGLGIDQAVVGDAPVQKASEITEEATSGGPPGPRPPSRGPPDRTSLGVVRAYVHC